MSVLGKRSALQHPSDDEDEAVLLQPKRHKVNTDNTDDTQVAAALTRAAKDLNVQEVTTIMILNDPTANEVFRLQDGPARLAILHMLRQRFDNTTCDFADVLQPDACLPWKRLVRHLLMQELLSLKDAQHLLWLPLFVPMDDVAARQFQTWLANKLSQQHPPMALDNKLGDATVLQWATRLQNESVVQWCQSAKLAPDRPVIDLEDLEAASQLLLQISKQQFEVTQQICEAFDRAMKELMSLRKASASNL